MTNKQKDSIDFFTYLYSNFLIPIIGIPLLLFVGGLIIKKGFSLKINIIFFIWLLFYMSFLVYLLYFSRLKNKTIRKSSTIRFSFTLLGLILSSIFLFFGYKSEPLKGTLIIHGSINSTNIPDKIYITRGFPKFLSFLDKIIELKRDPNNNTFSTPYYVRCGEWYLFPEPYREYNPIEEIFNISKESLKCEKHILFHKCLCKVHFFTEDEGGNPINGASIKIEPPPYVLSSDDKTPCTMDIEMGTYTIAFTLDGFEEYIINNRMISGDDEIEIKVKFKKILTEEAIKGDKPPLVKNPPENKRPKIENNQEDKTMESRRFIQSLKLVEYYIQTNNISSARDLLNKMKSEFRDNEKYYTKIINLLQSIENINEEEK